MFRYMCAEEQVPTIKILLLVKTVREISYKILGEEVLVLPTVCISSMQTMLVLIIIPSTTLQVVGPLILLLFMGCSIL